VLGVARPVPEAAGVSGALVARAAVLVVEGPVVVARRAVVGHVGPVDLVVGMAPVARLARVALAGGVEFGVHLAVVQHLGPRLLLAPSW